MSNESKIEKALAGEEVIPVDKPTITANQVKVERQVNSAMAVQFTPEVLSPEGVKPMRQEDNIDFNVGHAIVHLRNGVDLKVNCNDWLIIHENGSYEVVKEGDFIATWKVVEPKTKIPEPSEPAKSTSTLGSEIKEVSPELAAILAKRNGVK